MLLFIFLKWFWCELILRENQLKPLQNNRTVFFFVSSLETVRRDSEPEADHAIGETYDRHNHATSLLY